MKFVVMISRKNPLSRSVNQPLSCLVPLAWLLIGGLVAPQIARATADSILVFNEIHYNQADGSADSEWIEFRNLNGVDVDVSGWRLRGGADFEFPQGTVVEGRGFLLVAADPGDPKLAGKGAIGPFSGKLNNGGESLRIENRDRRTMDRIAYDDSGDWPVGADGSGATLAKRDQRSADNRPANWVASREIGGTPGALNFPLSGGPPLEIETVIAGWDAEWRYNESDDLAPGWEDNAHGLGGNWSSGSGVFGWGDSPPLPIGTGLSRPVFNNPYVVTYYFEREFSLTQSQIDNLARLEIEHLFDDGGVVYINGEEVFRNEMPAGVPDSETLSTGTGDPDPSERTAISALSLVPGSNRVSVEVHQQGLGNSDVMFGLRMTLIEHAPEPSETRDILLFNELSAFDRPAGFRLEITNVSGESVALDGYQIGFSEGGTFAFTGGSLEAGGFAVLDKDVLGFAPGDDDRLFLYDPDGELVDARRVTGRLRGRAPTLEGRWLYPSTETFGSENSFEFETDIVINEIMYHPRALPATADIPAVLETATLVDFGDVWRYNDGDPDLPVDWAAAAHAVGGDWQSAPAVIGRESSPLPEPISTPLTSYVHATITYYFEREFDITAQQLAALDSLEITHQIDDGAIFYINGVELEGGRFNMDPGAIDPETLASPDVVDAALVPFTFSNPGLVVGTNRISVEVHQSSAGSADLVFGLKLDLHETVSPFVPGQPQRPSDETWIELYNRSVDRTIDLGGWRFSDGIDFEFPAGTTLAPGGFLVVAKDAAELSAKHPGATVLGDFGGSLSRSGERLRLVDATGNPTDEVRYADGGRWPGAADGGASSLVLRDPDADNSSGGAWSASEESHRGGWEVYTRTGRGSNGRSDPSGFHELVFGLLQAGEFLIDDISVIEDPGEPTARELIQNGDFSSGGAEFWRMRGTHRHFEVVDDPDAPGNKVLHVKASGATEHMHNCAETTLKAGGSYVALNSGKDYRISFRARWLSGSNQLNSRLYFNRLPRTDLLTIHDEHGGGTPGTANSALEVNSGPTFASARHAPAVPAADQAAEITVNITDPDGIASTTVHFSVDGAPFQETAMTGGAGGRFAAVIPGQVANTRVQFYIEAVDSLGARSFFPREAAASRAMIPWDDGQARLQLGSVAPTNLRIVMPVAEANAMHAVTELMSNDRLPCTVIHNEQEIYYGCKVRLKSSQRGRTTEARVGFNLKFPPDNKFLGCHGSIVFDRSFGDEIIVKHMAAQVGGVPAMFDDLAWLVQPRANRADAGILLKSRFDDEWRDNQFPDGGDGSMYEYELIYYPFNTTGGPEGLKFPVPDGVAAVPMRNQGGDDKELYRWHWLAKNNRDADDFSGIIRVLDTMGLTGAAYNAAIGDVIDVDQWLRAFAFLQLAGIFDSYGTWETGAWHNAIFYLRTTDQRAMFFPWDMDQVFLRSVTSGVTSSPDLNKLIGASPANERAYYGHLLDMIESKFNSGYMQGWLDHYSQFLPGENIVGRSAYINTRGNHVRGLIDSAVAAIPYRVTTSSGGSTPGSTTTVSGDAWVDVRELRLAGTQVSLGVTWVDDNSWELTLPVTPGANSYTIEAIGFDGSVIGSDTFSIAGTGSLVPADAATLAISEIHYHPLAPDEDEIAAGFGDAAMFEWVELLNLSESVTLDLGNVSFDDGIALVIPLGTTLAPGKRLVVPAHAAAFTHRYGALEAGELLALSFLGDDGTNRLSNSGARLELSSAANEPIAEFSYSDSRPWPISADGDGYSLTLMCPGRNAPTLPDSWRSSASLGGSPGTHDALPLAEWVLANGVADLYGDTDLDGIESLIEYLAGSDPNRPNGLALSTGFGSGGEVTLEFVQRIGADEADLLAEQSDSLQAWETGVEYWGRENNGDGTATLRFRSSFDVSPPGRGYLRLSVSEKQ